MEVNSGILLFLLSSSITLAFRSPSSFNPRRRQHVLNKIPLHAWRNLDPAVHAAPAPSDTIPWDKNAYLSSLDLYDNLTTPSDTFIAGPITAALSCLSSSLRLYGPSSTISSYNGGKDACVIMHLHRAAHANFYRSAIEHANENDRPPPTPIAPRVVYFDNPDEFPEILSLLHKTTTDYHLDMICLCNTTFSAGLGAIINASSPPANLAFVLGTRRGDPNVGSQGQFAPSSSWMPPFMRVNPVLSWSYGHIWHFLRLFNLPYCELYDQGFTSLGKVGNTRPTPALKKPGDASTGYWPAYMLTDYERERDGREAKETPPFKPVDTALSTPVTVGLLIIGDEILNGRTRDVNGHAAALALAKLNIPLDHVVVVQDDEDTIVDAVHKMSQRVDVIVTSGGLGPTHDDVTLSALSVALDSPLAMNGEMRAFVARKTKDAPLDVKVQDQLCTLPMNAKLLYLKGEDEWPVLQVGKCYVLPGVPQFFSKSIDCVASHLQFQEKGGSVFKVVLLVDETSEGFVTHLNTVVANNPFVIFGSYPEEKKEKGYKTVVSVEARLRGRRRSMVGEAEEWPGHGEMEEKVAKGLAELLEGLDKTSVLRVE